MLDLKQVPQTPGIYKFFSENKIIYIGKAINLKKEFPLTLGHHRRIVRPTRLSYSPIELKHFLLKLKPRLCY